MGSEKKKAAVEDYLKDSGADRFNILWVVLDHVTFRHFKLMQGAVPMLPAYERLAREGCEFTNCHSVHPLCLPARATMLTGVYANNHGKLDNGDYPDCGLPFYTDYLQRLGYRTGYFGKITAAMRISGKKAWRAFIRKATAIRTIPGSTGNIWTKMATAIPYSTRNGECPQYLSRKTAW